LRFFFFFYVVVGGFFFLFLFFFSLCPSVLGKAMQEKESDAALFSHVHAKNQYVACFFVVGETLKNKILPWHNVRLRVCVCVFRFSTSILLLLFRLKSSLSLTHSFLSLYLSPVS